MERIIKLYRKGEPVSVEQALVEFRAAATDAGIDHGTPDAILAGDAVDQESVYDLLGITCAESRARRGDIDQARESAGGD
jgi:hypothetical protein